MTDPTAEGGLRRSLGVRDVALYFVVACTNLQWVATAAAAGPSSLLAWIIGLFAMFVPISVCVVFLASRYPDHGGLYVWSKRAFGPFAGFMTGWTYWTGNLSYFPGLMYFAAANLLFVGGTAGAGNADGLAGAPLYFVAVALLGIGVGTWLNVLGLGVGKRLSNAGAYTRTLATLLLIVLGVVAWWRFGPATRFDATTLVPRVGIANLIFWSTIAFAWTGPESASFMGGEIEDPRRTVPRALAIAAPLIAAIYILGTLSVLVAVPPSATSPMYGVMDAIAGTGTRLGIGWVVPLGACLLAFTCVGSVGAWIGSVARIPFVAGIDSYLPKAFGRMHPRYGSPANALITQAALACLFAVLGQAGSTVKGAYDVLVSMMVIATMLPFLFLFAIAIRLSADPPAPGELRIPGGRATIIAMALVGLATTLGSIALAALPQPGDTHWVLALVKIVGGTVVVVGAGAVVYALGSRRIARAASAAAAT